MPRLEARPTVLIFGILSRWERPGRSPLTGPAPGHYPDILERGAPGGVWHETCQ